MQFMADDKKSSSSGNAQEKFESGKAHAQQAAADLRSAAEQKASEWRSEAEGMYGEVRGRVSNIQEEGERFIRDNPMRAVGYAFGIGVVLGFLFRR
jgi:ElaB/YqjD/DUF883 family membrane-anchored ribosome-binding protein